MVDFHNPVIIEKDFLALVKLWHVLDGIFIWEFLVTFDYELSVIRGHRPYRWTIWIYSLTRVCALIAVILHMLGFDSSSPIHCQLWVMFELIFSCLAFAAASLLIVLRIIAIWNKNRIAVAIAICTWNTNVAFLIYNIALTDATWEPTQSVCEVLNTETTKGTTFALLITDVVLLLTMLVGLLRFRQDGTMIGVGKFLWRQGLIWLFLATIAEVPPAVFISLDLNYPFNLMFQTPALIVMSIAATRMHRSLSNFINSDSRVNDICTPLRGRKASADPKLNFSGQIPLDRVEVALHKPTEDYPPAEMGQYDSYSVVSQSQDELVPSIGDDLDIGNNRG